MNKVKTCYDCVLSSKTAIGVFCNYHQIEIPHEHIRSLCPLYTVNDVVKIDIPNDPCDSCCWHGKYKGEEHCHLFDLPLDQAKKACYLARHTKNEIQKLRNLCEYMDEVGIKWE